MSRILATQARPASEKISWITSDTAGGRRPPCRRSGAAKMQCCGSKSAQPFPQYHHYLRGHHARRALFSRQVQNALLKRHHHVRDNLVLQTVPHWHVIPRLGLKIHIQDDVDVGVRLGGVLGKLPVVDQHVAVSKSGRCSRRHTASVLTLAIGAVHHHIVVNLIPQSPDNWCLNTEAHDTLVIGLAGVADIATEIAPWHPFGIRREIRDRLKGSRQHTLDLMALMQRPPQLALGSPLGEIALDLEQVWDSRVGSQNGLLLNSVGLVDFFSKEILGRVAIIVVVLDHVTRGILRRRQHTLVHQILRALQADGNRQRAQDIVGHCGPHLQGRHHLRA
mmetsp:Transcript_1655/g.3646  ORF Transcript_1655/g.3646 Transcript_1655/m.3646 type:complete len:335 (+) Transcript_1655:93-1097(+)